MTHTVFYVTGFDPRMGRGLNAHSTKAVGRALRLMALKFQQQGKTDLALECALASAILTSSIEEVERFVLLRCLEELERRGAIASERDDRSEEVCPSGSADEWDKCYHTMLVLGITARVALALLTGTSEEPPAPNEQGLTALGAIVSHLERYHLARAATGLASCAPRTELERDLMSFLVDELADQENGPSAYGFMVDEKALHRLHGGDDFESKMTAPLSALAATCLEKARLAVAKAVP